MWSGSPDQVVLSPWLHSLPAYLDHFALGHGARGPRRVAAAAALAVRSPASWSRLLAFWVVSLRIGIGLQLFEPYTRWQWMGRHLLYGVIGCALVAVAVAAVPGRGRAACSPAAPRSSSARSPTGSTSGT